VSIPCLNTKIIYPIIPQMKKMRLLPILAAAILIAGCCNCQEKAVEEKKSVEAESRRMCEGYGQQYQASWKEGQGWRVLCTQSSPSRWMIKDVQLSGTG
jgi:outer membrane PBP1 activator LpoA protein